MLSATCAAAGSSLPIRALRSRRTGDPVMSSNQRHRLRARPVNSGTIVRAFELHRDTVEAAMVAAGRIPADPALSAEQLALRFAYWTAELIAAAGRERGDPLKRPRQFNDAEVERVTLNVISTLARATQQYVATPPTGQ